MEKVNFDSWDKSLKVYGGANGLKMAKRYNGIPYLIKLPGSAKQNPLMPRTSLADSEYLGSHIFSLLGMDAQETIYGFCTHSGLVYDAVACRDFCYPGWEFKDFNALRSSLVFSPSRREGVAIDHILASIDSQTFIDAALLRTFFWDLFVVDAFIGNFDRHSGN